MRERQYFIKCVAESIRSNNCELFVGSGVSCAAGLPNWKDLLSPIAHGYGFDVDACEDLPLLAQYILNANVLNRSQFAYHISKECDIHNVTSRLHQVISNMSFLRYWTTNYDPLLEEVLVKRARVSVISKDNDLKSIHDDSIKVFKLHGSYCEPDTIVLTRDDYDNYFLTHPLIKEQFSASLTSRSLLFIGYSYNDPDIRMIMTVAQTQLNGTQPHYMIIKRPESKAEPTQLKLFESWILELRRIGIQPYCINSYDELPDILHEIDMRSRGRSVFITGSHKQKDDIQHKAAIIDKILKDDGVLINGQSAGIGLSFLNSFCEKAFEKKLDIFKHLRLFVNPYSINSRFSDDSKLIPELQRVRYDLFRHTRLMILYPGGMGSIAEQELAIEQGCCILPIIACSDDYDNDAIRFFLNNHDAKENLMKHTKDYAEILEKKGIPSEADILKAINDVWES